MLALAFADDPIVRWPLPSTDDVHDRIERVFGLIYEGVVDAGAIWEAGDAEGFAVWIPAGTAEDMFESDAAARTRVAPLTDDDGARYDGLWSWIESRVPDDAWYLDAIGVRPDRQGAGIGGALVRFGLERAAQEDAPCFLETATERNVGYYERFGFRVTEEGEPTSGGPHIWFMSTEAVSPPR